MARVWRFRPRVPHEGAWFIATINVSLLDEQQLVDGDTVDSACQGALFICHSNLSLHAADGHAARREKCGCPARKELPVLNMWRRSRKAINRELHAVNRNTSTPVAASPMRNVRPRVQVANDDDVDASLAPTVVVPPTPALPVDQFFMSNAQPVLDMAADEDMDALFPVTTVGAPTSVHQRTEREDRLESLF